VKEIEEWVKEGEQGRVMCYSCRHFQDVLHDHGALVCRGCPIAWRTTGTNKAEYYREPEFGTHQQKEM
jgi:hypothetical protein